MGLIPGIGISAFAPKSANYADIGVVSSDYRLFYSASSNSFYTGYPTTAGNLIIVIIESNYDLNMIASPNWTRIGSWGGSGTSLEAYYWFSNGTYYSFSLGTITENSLAWIMEISGVDTVNPIGNIASVSQPNIITAQSCPGVDAIKPKSLIVNSLGARDGDSRASCNGWTNANLTNFVERMDKSYANTHQYGATGILASGSSGVSTATTYPGGTPTVGLTMAINPAII